MAQTAQEVDAAFAFRAAKPGKQFIVDTCPELGRRVRAIAIFAIMSCACVITKMAAVKAVGELPGDVAAIQCLVLSQAIAGVERFKDNILDDYFPITFKGSTYK